MLKDDVLFDLKKIFIDSDIKIFTTDDKHFNIIIISDIFINKSTLDRQKMVYDVIGKYVLNKQIHAVSFKTYTKTEMQVII